MSTTSEMASLEEAMSRLSLSDDTIDCTNFLPNSSLGRAVMELKNAAENKMEWFSTTSKSNHFNTMVWSSSDDDDEYLSEESVWGMYTDDPKRVARNKAKARLFASVPVYAEKRHITEERGGPNNNKKRKLNVAKDPRFVKYREVAHLLDYEEGDDEDPTPRVEAIAKKRFAIFKTEQQPMLGYEKSDKDDAPDLTPPLTYTEEDMNNVERFVKHHQMGHGGTMQEIKRGQKTSHWIWFILPTPPYMVNGVERGSARNRFFAIRSDAEVMAYLNWVEGVNLRRNYIDTLAAILLQLQAGNTLEKLLGADSVKAVSSIGLFKKVAYRIKDQMVFFLCNKVLELAQRGS